MPTNTSNTSSTKNVASSVPTSTLQSALFGVNNWQALYQTSQQADFRSYDFDTLRNSFVNYLQLYYPETFNDYTESSEYIALLDVMAYMGQGLAFRNDLNSRENFLATAERRDSVVKLANLVSYTPLRNIAGQGWLKVTSISTTQNITDINGTNLSNIPVLWNDPANPSWLEQMNTIWNAALVSSQRIGQPGNISNILGVTTSEYAIQIPPTSLPIAPFTSTIDGMTMNFELCSVTSLNEDYIYEIPPAPSGRFNMVYRNDQLGFGSPATGFFFYFKQGTLQNYDFTLQQQVSNQIIPIGAIQGVNNTDTWLYQLNADGTTPLWTQVQSIYADAHQQTVASGRTIFSVNSGYNDQVSYVFGDGIFSQIPLGSYRAYVRAGNALTYTINPSEMNGIAVSFTYLTAQGSSETLTIGLSLQQTVSTAQARETLANIKQNAPAQYYTQNRMVNGEDYSNFPYTQYNSIVKSKAINRASVGVSKNLDLLDPTGKYSSTNSFGSDGGLYQTDASGVLALTINNTGDILSFFSNSLASVLSLNRANQYYIQNYPRYAVVAPQPTDDDLVYWNTSAVDTGSETGYFYTKSGSLINPISIGTFGSTTGINYLTTGAICQFQAPTGFYFDSNNRLVAGIPGPNNSTTLWSTILNVVTDGSNNGQGTFSNGVGPVTINGYVPTGVILTQVIPVFGNSIPNTVIQECVLRMELQQDFSLVFDNALLVNQDRWSVSTYGDTTAFVQFLSQGNNSYIITYKSLTYYFGSVVDTRFTFASGEVVYDPFTGKTIQDFINVLGINSQPMSNTALGQDYVVNILGQTVQSDGYVNDFQVEVAATDVNDNQLILNPDFFNEITGYVNGGANIGVYAFFEIVQDPINLTRHYLIPTTDVVYQYANTTQIELVKYDYPLGQLFYAYTENVFYITVQDYTVTTPSYSLVSQPQYAMLPGRQGLSYQYRHNSNNTNRIDPTTTNIIDLYVVTQAYYTAYTNWVIDTTGTIPKPTMPNTAELAQEYGKLQDYKMLSDSLILNSVVFKPLFGPNANPALQGTIKVVPTSTTNASTSEIRSAVLTAMNDYFNINNWNFGDTFYFSQLSAYLHSTCGDLISSAVLVSNDPTQPFGTLYQIQSLPYEIFVNGATANQIQVIAANTPAQLQIGY